MPSPSCLSLSMHKGFCNSSSCSEAHAFCLSICAFLCPQQASHTSPTVLAKWSLSALSLPSLQCHCLNISLPTTPNSSMTLPLLQCFSQAASILDRDMWTPFYIPTAACPPFCPPKSQLITFSAVVFLSSPIFPPHSLPILAPSPSLPPVHHPAAVHSFLHSLQLPGQTKHCRGKFSRIFLKE